MNAGASLAVTCAAMKTRVVAAVAALALLPLSARADEKRTLTADDLVTMPRVGDPAVSPDGTLVAYTVSTYDADEDRRNADVWIVPTAGGAPRRVTTSRNSDSAPAWSPDGKRLAFVGKRESDKQNQIYVIPVDGGEAERVTDMPMAASGPKWTPDGKRIVFVSHVVLPADLKAETAAAEKTEDALARTKKVLDEREKKKVKARVSETRLFRFWDRWLTDDEYPHLFVVDLATRKVSDLIPGSRRYFSLQEGNGDFDLSPDGASVVFEANSTEPPFASLDTDLYVVSTTGGTVRNLTAANPGEDSSPVYSPDGRSIAYGMSKRKDGFPDRSRLALLDLASGRTTVLTEDWDRNPQGWAFAADGKSLVFRAEDRARTNVYAMPVAGGPPRLVWKGGSASGGEVTSRGEIVFGFSTLTHAPEIAVVKADGTGFRELTSHTADVMSKIALGETKDMTFKGAGGDDVQMWVVFPPGFDAKRKWPLVQMIHGGPIGTFPDQFHFRWNAQAFAAAGHVVALVNFHGSSSFGQKWVESILGAHADKPFEDVMKATDHLIAQGWVDEKRMAAAGGSYGGYLVNWIAGHTNRFAALVSHAGVYDHPGQYASDGTWGRVWSYGGTPWNDLDKLHRSSPSSYAKGFVTPTLILHGERDFRVPVHNGLEFYGVLTAKGVPARLVYYPDENHWILKGQNFKHWMGEVSGWLARWFGGVGASR